MEKPPANSILTLEDLLKATSAKISSHTGRIRLMRHACRGHKAQLAQLKKWGVTAQVMPVKEAYGVSDEDALPQQSGTEVINEIRWNPKLAEVISAEQGSDCLKEGDVLLAFAATGGKTAEYVAAFECHGLTDWEYFQQEYAQLLRKPPQSAQQWMKDRWIVRGLGYNCLPHPGGELYRLEPRDDILPGLERRLIIDWQSTVSWLQNRLDKEVMEIRPKGFVREFPGFLNFGLKFKELQAVTGKNGFSGDSVWTTRLASVAGVYLIRTEDGHAYVGSACGKEGILGRWAVYAETAPICPAKDEKKGLRGNTGLRRYLDQKLSNIELERRCQGLQFSILKTMDRSASQKEVLEMEEWFKTKLQSRTFGANAALNRGLNDN